MRVWMGNYQLKLSLASFHKLIYSIAPVRDIPNQKSDNRFVLKRVSIIKTEHINIIRYFNNRNVTFFLLCFQ